MTVADKLRIEHRGAPRAPGRRADEGRRMRRAHDPSRFCRRGVWRRRDPQQKAGDAGGLRRQGQLAACHQIKTPRVAPDFQHHGAQCIAGERVRSRPQRALDIGRAHAHDASRVEAEFGEATHRQRARFQFGKILPHPYQRPSGRDPPGQPDHEPGRGRAVPACFSEHLMHRAQSKPALQRRIGLGMAERHPARRMCAAMGLEPFDAAAQRRKRGRACAHHAPLPLRMMAASCSENQFVKEPSSSETSGWLICS